MRTLCAAMLVLFVTGCAGTKGEQDAAIASYITYETLAPTCAEAAASLTKIQRVRRLTPDEEARLGQMTMLYRVLESYKRAYNLYVDSRSASTREDLRRILNQVIDLGLSLNLVFEARRI